MVASDGLGEKKLKINSFVNISEIVSVVHVINTRKSSSMTGFLLTILKQSKIFQMFIKTFPVQIQLVILCKGINTNIAFTCVNKIFFQTSSTLFLCKSIIYLDFVSGQMVFQLTTLCKAITTNVALVWF